MKQFVKALLGGIKSFFASIECIVICVYRCFQGKRSKFENNQKKDSVFIMGNGPSLNDVDLDQLRSTDHKICCVNYFPLKNDRFFTIKPEYICLLDPAFYDAAADSMKKDLADMMKKLELVDWKLTVIAPAGKKLHVNNPHISYSWINMCTAPAATFTGMKYWLFKHNLANPGAQNVVLGALYYFLSSNFGKIYVTGVDMSEFKFVYVDENNRVYVESTHSYGTKRIYYDEMPSTLGLNEFCNILGAYHKMFVQFSAVGKYAKHQGIKVINLAVNSYVDVFEKKAPSELFHH